MLKENFRNFFPFLLGTILGLLILSPLILLFFKDNLIFSSVQIAEFLSQSTIFKVILIFAAISVFITLTLSFLESTSSSQKRRNLIDLYKIRVELKKDFDNLESNILSSQINLTDEERKSFLKSLECKFESEAYEEYYNKLNSKISENIYSLNFEEKTESMLQRLEIERQSLSKRGNFNLTIGMTLSIIGLTVFGVVLLNAPQYEDIKSLFINTLPKTLFVLLIELFSYFFLNLYKNSLDEIKYYQNEITNLESKHLALRVAKSMNNHKMMSIILEELVKTERNFILEKDQTTIELEKKRIDSTNSNNTLQTIKDILKIKS